MASDPGRVLTRRQLVHFVGGLGGAAGAYTTLSALGLIETPGAKAAASDLEPGSGKGTKVAIIGAGIAGLVAAYELDKAGYEVRVLEARERPGGRCWTIRGGDRVEETDIGQRCGFDADPSLYFNPGPARIAHHHRTLLGYCRELGVPLQVMVNENRAAFVQHDRVFGGRRLTFRQAAADSRGAVAELLAKAVQKGALDQELDARDRERLYTFLRGFGDLPRDLGYRGSGAPGAGDQPGQPMPPLPLKELLGAQFTYFTLPFFESLHQAAPMLEPVGGMDRIAAAFAQRLAGRIEYRAVVSQLRRTDKGARLIVTDLARQTERPVEADHVLVTAPLSALESVDADFSEAHHRAIRAPSYVKAAKIAFQAKRRFWEEDDGIYGGISWTNRDITQIWYPSHDFHGRRGIVVGGYIWTDRIGDAFGALPPEIRAEAAVASGERLHPGYGREVEHPVSVAWAKVPWSQGAWAEWSQGQRQDEYRTLLEPDGPFHFAGEHLSYLPGWQEGAAVSAIRAIRQIAERTTRR